MLSAERSTVDRQHARGDASELHWRTAISRFPVTAPARGALRSACRDPSASPRSMRRGSPSALLGDSIGGQRVHARIRISARPAAAFERVASTARSSCTAQRRREQADIRLGSICGRKPGAGRTDGRWHENAEELSTARSRMLSRGARNSSTGYQDRAYAERYRARVERLRRSRSRRPGSAALREAVARNYFNLLAYKDEYEVARLTPDRLSWRDLRRNFGSTASSSSIFRRRCLPSGSRHGAAQEIRVRPWVLARHAVARAAQAAARDGKLDVFRWSRERRHGARA